LYAIFAAQKNMKLRIHIRNVPERQYMLLQRKANQLGISFSELIRGITREYLRKEFPDKNLEG
jgi:hypothetical protein